MIETVALSELPLVLPEVDDYRPTGNPEPPLGKAKDWLDVTRDGKRLLVILDAVAGESQELVLVQPGTIDSGR